MNTNTRNAFTRVGAGAGALALCAALTLGAAASAQATGFAPTAGADSYAVTANTPLSVSAANGLLANDADPEGDAISAVNVGPGSAFAAGESLVANTDGSFTYTPPTDFVGTRIWSYRPADDTDQGPVVTITFTITGNVVVAPINLKPLANDDFYPVTQGVLLSIPASGVLANDVDFDGDPLTMNKGALEPAGGVLPGEAMALWADGHFDYQPPTGFTGTRTWTYGISDGAIDSNLAEIVFTITAPVAPANTAPVANADNYSVVKDVPVAHVAPGFLVNDTDIDGDALQFDSIVAPAGGLLPGENFNPSSTDGAFAYTPPTGFVGDRVFTYTASDGTALSNATTITFHITAAAPVNAAPVANPDAYFVVKDVPFTRLGTGYVENDSDADGDALFWANLYMPNGGLLPGEDLTMLTFDGAFTYTPPTGFIGTREFMYLATDGTADSNYATITFTIQQRGGDNPLIPNEPQVPEEPEVPTSTDDSTVPTLASTGSTPAYALGTLAAMVAGLGFVLVRGSRRVA